MIKIDMETTYPSISADTASALAWLVDAGLDVPVMDIPRHWLMDAAVKETPQLNISDAAKPVAKPVAAKVLSRPDLSGIDSLPALEAALLGLAHPLTNGAQRMFAGAVNAPLLVVAEMPLATDSDEALLRAAMLETIGLADSESASVAIMPWPTRGQRPARDADIALFSPFALRAVELMTPKLILGLGGRAAALAEPEAAPATLRGRWLSLANTPMIATFAPAMLLRQPRLKADAWADLQRLAERMTA